MTPATILLLLRLGGLFALVAGLAAAVYGLRKVQLARQSRSWPTVPGRVVALECSMQWNFDGTPVFESVTVDKLKATPIPISSKAKTRFIPRVRYRYRPEGGEEREGTSIFLGGEHLGYTPPVAATHLERYTVGQIVSVYVQPGHPVVSVLEPGLRARSAIVLGMGAALALVGLLWSVIAWTALAAPPAV